MFGYKLIAFSCAICLTAWGNTAEQSDWSGGPGSAGPVTSWNDSFHSCQQVDWAHSTGVVTLQEGCTEHLIAEDFGNAAFLACDDFDNDGDNDVACASYGDHQLAWFENNGDGTVWTEHLIESYLPSACVLSTGDMDLDGLPDLMCASEGGDGICWWKNVNWAESWVKNEVDTTCNYPFSMEPADFDGDQDEDLCAALYGRGEIVWYSNDDSTGTQWTKHVIRDGFPSAWWAVPDDFNGDGYWDVAGARHGGEICWWENDSTGSFTVEHTIETGYIQCTTIRNCDLNGDGAPDIAATSNSGKLAWWENHGTGTDWTSHTIDEDLSGAWSLWAADMDNDGDQDVIGNDRKGDFVYLYENLDGSGTRWLRITLDHGMDMSNDVCASDLDGDGFRDPLATFGGDDTIYWWKLGEGYATDGSLVSSILDSGGETEWEQISWNCSEPGGTQVQLQVRAGNDPEQLGEWITVPESGSGLSTINQDEPRYFQYRTILAAEGTASPSLFAVIVQWSSTGIGEEQEAVLFLGDPAPNPATGMFTVPVSIPTAGELIVFDQTGRQVLTVPFTAGTRQVTGDLGHLSSGTYHLMISRENVRKTAGLTLLTR